MGDTMQGIATKQPAPPRTFAGGAEIAADVTQIKDTVEIDVS